MILLPSITHALFFSSNDGIVSEVDNGCNCSVVRHNGLRVQISTDSKYYEREQDVCIEFIVTNISKYMIKLLFPSSHKYKLQVYREGELFYEKLIGEVGVSFLSIYNLRSGQSLSCRTVWNPDDIKVKDITGGSYYLKMTLIANPYIESGLVDIFVENE